MIDTLSIGMLVEDRYKAQSQPAGMISALQACGHRVALLDPQSSSYEAGNNSWLSKFDLIIARGRSLGLLYLLAWAEVQGVPTINRRAAIASVHNKAEMAVALAGKNFPTPRTFLGPVNTLTSQVPDSCYPVIFKPIFGDNSNGLRVVQNSGEIEGLHWPEATALVQQYLPSDGCDLKLYGIGDRIWVVRKPASFSPDLTSNSKLQIECLPTTQALGELGYECGKLFGLDFYGVDCIHTPDGLVVIEVNDFPNYTGLTGIGKELANYAVHRAIH